MLLEQTIYEYAPGKKRANLYHGGGVTGIQLYPGQKIQVFFKNNRGFYECWVYGFSVDGKITHEKIGDNLRIDEQCE